MLTGLLRKSSNLLPSLFRNNFSCISSVQNIAHSRISTTAITKPILCTNNKLIVPINLTKRFVSFLNKPGADQLWKSVTTVSNAGKNRGRGRGNRRARSKDLNRGQIIGQGRNNMLFPGLTGPVIQGRAIVKQKALAPNEEYFDNLTKVRDSMGNFKPMKLAPSDRGWSGSRFPGRRLGAPENEIGEPILGFDSVCLDSSMVCRMDGKLGRVRRNRFVMFVGNGKGVGGFAIGKAPAFRAASTLAKNRAVKQLFHVKLDGNTIYHDFYEEFNSTKVMVFRKQPGYGIVAHRGIKSMCELLGITDIRAKVEGSTNMLSIIKAFCLGLLKQKTHQEYADLKKLHVVRFDGGVAPVVVASPSDGVVRTQGQLSSNEELDYMTYAKKGVVFFEKEKSAPFYTRLPSYEKYLLRMEHEINHDLIKHRLALAHGSVTSFYTQQYPECDPNWRPAKEEVEIEE